MDPSLCQTFCLVGIEDLTKGLHDSVDVPPSEWDVYGCVVRNVRVTVLNLVNETVREPKVETGVTEAPWGCAEAPSEAQMPGERLCHLQKECICFHFAWPVLVSTCK